jgi:hypothetical protein
MALSAKSDPLEAINMLVPWESFCGATAAANRAIGPHLLIS